MAQVEVLGFRSEKDMRKDNRKNSRLVGFANDPGRLTDLINDGAQDKEFNCLGYYVNDKRLPDLGAAYRAVGATVISPYSDSGGLIIHDHNGRLF